MENEQESQAQNAPENGQEIINHLEGHSLESPRFQAFADFVDLKEIMTRPASMLEQTRQLDTLSRAMIEETMRQRRNGMKGYADEEVRMDSLSGPLLMAVFKQWTKRKEEDPTFRLHYERSENRDSFRDDYERAYAKKLQEIKTHEIIKRNRQS